MNWKEGIRKQQRKMMNEEFTTLEDEACVVCFAYGHGDAVVYGPFVDDEEAETFVACGPHGLEEYTEYAVVCPLYPPHAQHVELMKEMT